MTYPSILLSKSVLASRYAVPSPQMPTGRSCRKRVEVSSTPKQVSDLSDSGAKESSTAVQLQEYAQLRERYLRTTNALASAAHDLKTPLAILNGYVELL